MVKFNSFQKQKNVTKDKKSQNNNNSGRYKKLARLGTISAYTINEISSPIDAANRFINLTLQTVEENSQSREFLLQSKQGIRRTLLLLKKLNNYAKRIEREIREMSTGRQ